MTKRLLLTLFLAAGLSAQPAQRTNKENMTHDRGRTPVARIGKIVNLSGVLFDAGCKDRSAMNLAAPAESIATSAPAESPDEATAAKNSSNLGPSSAHGITVDAATVAAERADILPHEVGDLRTREADPSCALTGATSAYAVRLDDGRLLNLDAGGNTLASEAVLQSQRGRDMLNGAAYGFKPRVKVTGQIRGDRVVVEQITIS